MLCGISLGITLDPFRHSKVSVVAVENTTGFPDLIYEYANYWAKNCFNATMQTSELSNFGFLQGMILSSWKQCLNCNNRNVSHCIKVAIGIAQLLSLQGTIAFPRKAVLELASTQSFLNVFFFKKISFNHDLMLFYCFQKVMGVTRTIKRLLGKAWIVKRMYFIHFDYYL